MINRSSTVKDRILFKMKEVGLDMVTLAKKLDVSPFFLKNFINKSNCNEKDPNSEARSFFSENRALILELAFILDCKGSWLMNGDSVSRDNEKPVKMVTLLILDEPPPRD